MPAANAYPLTKLSQMFDVSRETLRKRLETITPADATTRAKYTPAQVLDAYVEYERLENRKRAGTENIDAEYEKARKDRAHADKLELELEVRRGEVMEATDVADTWSRHIANCRSRLLAMATKLSPIVVATDDPREAKQMIEDEIEAALKHLQSDAKG